MQDKTQQDLMSELCPNLRPLIARVLECECGAQTLDFFRRRPRAWLQMSDIAYHLRQTPKQTMAILNLLAEEGILERFTVLNTGTFYGLSQRHEILRALDQFWDWRDYWHAHLEQVKDALQLNELERINEYMRRVRQIRLPWHRPPGQVFVPIR